jgi:hypothetical protein
MGLDGEHRRDIALRILNNQGLLGICTTIF